MKILLLLLSTSCPFPAFAASPDPRAIETTLTAMADGVGWGEGIVDYLQKHHIEVEFARQSQPARSTGGKILLSDALPPLPRVLAPYIARETAIWMLAGLPAGPERDYMRDAIVARAWRELGGEKRILPKLDETVDYTDESLATMIRNADFRYQEFVQNPETVKPWLEGFLEQERLWRLTHRPD